jgi:hypothetical protein
MRRFVLPLACLALLAGPLPRASSEGEEHRNWKEEASYKAIQAAEAKALAALMRAAVKEDFRRQAWFLAERLLTAKPDDAEAAAVQEKWRDDELMLGMDPTPEFLRKLERHFAEFGDQYFHFGETLEGSGLDAVHYYEINVLAHTYNSPAANTNAALAKAGYVWLGTFLDHELKPLQEFVGPRLKQMTFPPVWDDGFLAVKIRWPEARVAAAGPWRLHSDLRPTEALRVLAALETAREFVVDELGGSAPAETTPVDVLLFAEGETYEKIGRRFLPDSDHADYLARSSWFDRPSTRIFASWRHRVNAWIGEDSNVLAEAAKVIARRHFGQNAGGTAQGRGAWLLDGLGGALEGVVFDAKSKSADVEPARCWRLAAAKALRADGALLPWDEFTNLDAEKAKATPKRTAKAAFRGGSFEARDVDVVAAQATAFVVGVMKADKGKGAKKVGDLLRELFKRDALPDLDKALGWKKGRWQAEAEKAIDAATGL